MSRIVMSTNVRAALKSRQRGFLLNPFRFGSEEPPPGGGGPAWEDVIALLHMDGSNGSTTFTDEKGGTWTASNAAITTAQSKFGGACGLFDWLSSGYITRAPAAARNFGANPHTIEFFMYAPAYRSGGRGVVSRRIGAVYCPFELNINGNGSFSLLLANSTNDGWAAITTFGTVSFSIETWTHVAFVFTGELIQLYVGGVKSNTEVSYTTIADSTQPIYLGRGGGGAADVYLDEARIVKGALYTEDFTPPSSPFPNS